MSTWDRMMLTLDGSRWWWVIVGFNIGLVFALALQELGIRL